MRNKVSSYYILIFLLIFFIKNVHAQDDLDYDYDFDRTTTPVSIDKNFVTRVAPPPLLKMPPVHFEGVHYEDNRHVKNRYPYLTRTGFYDRKESWRCWYEKLRCIRYQHQHLQVCAADTYRMQYSFVNRCEMEYYNCVLEYTRFYYGGEERECWYIWDVNMKNSINEHKKETLGYYYDTTHSWWWNLTVIHHPYYWNETETIYE